MAAYRRCKTSHMSARHSTVQTTQTLEQPAGRLLSPNCHPYTTISRQQAPAPHIRCAIRWSHVFVVRDQTKRPLPCYMQYPSYRVKLCASLLSKTKPWGPQSLVQIKPCSHFEVKPNMRETRIQRASVLLSMSPCSIESFQSLLTNLHLCPSTYTCVLTAHPY